MVVLGGGARRLALAIVLARFSVRSLGDRTARRPHEPRAIARMPRGIEMLEWLGLRDAFAAADRRAIVTG